MTVREVNKGRRKKRFLISHAQNGKTADHIPEHGSVQHG